MKLETNCQACRAPISTTLADITTDREAQAIAARLYCVPCGVRRALLVSAQGEAANDAAKAGQRSAAGSVASSRNKSGDPTASHPPARMLHTRDSL